MTLDGPAYASATAHHRAHDHDALRGLRLGPGMRVLDLGCGIGDLTSAVATAVDAGTGGGWAVGIDASQSCTRVASAGRRPGLAFVTARAQDVGNLLPAGALDAVLSVAALHWVPREDQPVVLAGVAHLLRPGGVLCADLGGDGQIAHVRAVLAPLARAAGAPECPWFFPSALEMGRLLVDAGLVVDVVRTVRQRRSMRDGDAITGWLESQVLPAYLSYVPKGDRQSFVKEAGRRCRDATRRDDGTHDQDYVRVRVLAGKRHRDADGVGSEPPGDYRVVADALASTAALIGRASVTGQRKALLSRRFRQAASISRRSPAIALETLGALFDETWDSGTSASN